MSILLYQSTKKKNNLINIKGNNFLFIGKYNQKYSYLLYKTGVNLKVYKNKNEIIIISGRHFVKKKINLFNSSILDIKNNLSGHYLVFKIKKNKSIEIFNDSCASIPLFTYKNKNENIFSNRLDWIINSSNTVFNIDWRQLFCHFFNSSYTGKGIFIKNIFFLDSDSIILINKNLKKNKSLNSTFKNQITNKSEINKVVERLSNILLENINNYAQNSKIVLPITSGTDSRLILAACLKLKKNFITLTHGFKKQKTYPDIDIAVKMSKKFKFKHIFVPFEKKYFKAVKYFENNTNHLLFNGQARHKDIFENWLYTKIYKRYRCNLELKGLLGGLFKSKWENKDLSPKLNLENIKPYKKYFNGNAKKSFLNLKNFYDKNIKFKTSDRSTKVQKNLIKSKFMNRVSAKFYFQNELFNSINPFIDMKFMNEYLKIPTAYRADGIIHLKMIEKIYPQLNSYPFLKDLDYFVFKKNEIQKLNLKEITKYNFSIINRKSIFYKLKKIFKKFRNQHKSFIPSDYEVIRNELNNYIIKEIKDFDKLIPNQLNIKDLIKDIQDPKKFDSRIYRFYSFLKFINHCNKKTKKIY